MFRLVITVSFLLSLPIADISTADAQGLGWFGGRGVGVGIGTQSRRPYNRQRRYNGSRGYGGASIFGFSFGPSPGSPPGYTAGYPDPYFLDTYGLDPWASGSFRAPDLLNDPYFYDRVPAPHRRYPRKYPSPYVPQTRHQVAKPMLQLADPYAPSRNAVAAENAQVQMSRPAIDRQLVKSLGSSARQLRENLKDYKRGDQWSAFLSLDQLSHWAASGETTALQALLGRFDSAIEKSDLYAVAEVEGYIETRNLLSQVLSQYGVEPAESSRDEPESLPTPQPETIPTQPELVSPQPELLSPQPEPVPTPTALDAIDV